MGRHLEKLVTDSNLENIVKYRYGEYTFTPTSASEQFILTNIGSEIPNCIGVTVRLINGNTQGISNIMHFADGVVATFNTTALNTEYKFGVTFYEK